MQAETILGDLDRLLSLKNSYTSKEAQTAILALQVILSKLLAETLQKESDSLNQVLIYGLTHEENDLMHKWPGNNRIPTIKRVRERTGLSLKEAKDLVDNWIIEMSYGYKTKEGWIELHPQYK